MRFNKAELLEDLAERAASIQQRWGFDAANGWAQVEGKGEEANRAYGEWSAITGILEDIRTGAIGW